MYLQVLIVVLLNQERAAMESIHDNKGLHAVYITIISYSNLLYPKH